MALFGGSVTIEQLDNSKNVEIKSDRNIFAQNTAYISGNAAYLNLCSSFELNGDIFTQNFGTKVSSGTLHIFCSGEAFQSNQTVQLKSLQFLENYAGQKGSAINLIGVNALIQNSTFEGNGAVDAYRESLILPPYTQLLN